MNTEKWNPSLNKMRWSFAVLLLGVFASGCVSLPSGENHVTQYLGELKFSEPTRTQIDQSEVMKQFQGVSDGICMFQCNGKKAIRITHRTEVGVHLKVKAVYGEPQRICVEIAEVESEKEPNTALDELFEAPSTSDSGGMISSVSVVLEDVQSQDARNIIVQYARIGSLFLGKPVKTIEAVFHPTEEGLSDRFYFDPVDPSNPHNLFKGPSEMMDRIYKMKLRDGQSVWVTYIETSKKTEIPQVINVVRKKSDGKAGIHP